MTYHDNEPTFFAPTIAQTPPSYELTVWGGGTPCSLTCGTKSVYWQGDEAAAITDRVDAGGPSELAAIWSEYEHVAQED